ncbi:MAG: hypothetical protein HFE76_11670 [Firmicutes bacterium]|nr:hypothetical protein [Bacillota bacterium]
MLASTPAAAGKSMENGAIGATADATAGQAAGVPAAAAPGAHRQYPMKPHLRNMSGP